MADTVWMSESKEKNELVTRLLHLRGIEESWKCSTHTILTCYPLKSTALPPKL